MTRDVSIIRLVDDSADIRIGKKRITVARRNVKGGTAVCPVELIIGALGS